MTDAETMERFDAFCKEVAREIRHEAAARGCPAEYVYLRKYPFILERYKKVVPEWTDTNMWSVENACCDDTVTLDLAEINRIRHQFDEPPLDFIPEVEGRMIFSAPKPKSPGSSDEQTLKYYAWLREEIAGVYHSAAARGVSARSILFECPWMTVGRIVRHFPALNPAWCLREMEWHLLSMKPTSLDPERVKALKTWHGTVADVATEIERGIREDGDPPLKQ